MRIIIKNISFNKTTGDRSSGDKDIQQIIVCFFVSKLFHLVKNIIFAYVIIRPTPSPPP